MGIFDGIGDAIGGIGDVVGGALGDIPVIGDALGAVGPALGPLAGMIPGIGPIASTVLGGLGGSAQGGGQGMLQGALGGLGTQQIAQTFGQSREDMERARELANQGIGQANQAADIAMQQFGLDQPLRQQFRQGAMGFHDPTNPFSSNPMAGMGGGGGGMIPSPPGPTGMGGGVGGLIPNPPGPTDMGGNAPQGPRPGTIRSRVEGLLNRRMMPESPAISNRMEMPQDNRGGNDQRGASGARGMPTDFRVPQQALQNIQGLTPQDATGGQSGGGMADVVRSALGPFGGTPGFNPNAQMRF